MNYTINFPYLDRLETEVLSKRNLKKQSHVVLKNSIFTCGSSGGLPEDSGSLGDLDIVDFYMEKDRLVHVVDGLIQENRLVQKLDLSKRINNLEKFTGYKLLELILKKHHGLEVVDVHYLDCGLKLFIPFEEDFEKAKKILQVLDRTCSSLIRAGLKTKLRRKDQDYYLLIKSLGHVLIQYPILSNTSQIRDINFLDFKLEDESLELTVLCGQEALDYYRQALADLDQIKDELQSPSATESVSLLLNRNRMLEEKNDDLLGYVFEDYIEHLDLPSFSTGRYSLVTHFIDNPYIKDPVDFVNSLDYEVVLAMKNIGQDSIFALKNRIEVLDIGQVLRKVHKVYPFEYKDQGYIRGKIDAEYGERFLEALDKYIREALIELDQLVETEAEPELEDGEDEEN